MSVMDKQVVGKTEGSKQMYQTISKREQEVLILTASGLNPAYIADELDISTSTVSQHLKNIRAKFNAKNTTHAVARALASNVIRL